MLRLGISRTVKSAVLWILLSIIRIAAKDESSESSCGLWLGPSMIKELEDHGFGLGMFTGRKIPEGELMPSELFLPLFDFDDSDHPPLREYMWSGDSQKQLVLESHEKMLTFVPGLAALAPCTSNNFNLERLTELEFAASDVHRATNPTAGAFTYYQIPMFRAIRDIQPGEELTVECPDDDFDAGVHIAKRYDPSDDRVYCLDDKIEEKKSSVPSIGRGLFAKTNLEQDSVVVSSPVAPLLRPDLDLTSTEPVGVQLLLNYCYGHPESDLLWVPYGPLMNAVNHPPPGKTANVRVQWHQNPIASNGDLARRQQYHHPELLDYSARRVSQTHGKSLVMDLVATREIVPGEELFLDYGKSWNDTWTAHASGWKKEMAQYSDTLSYRHAMEYNQLQKDEPVRTITEQHRNPYPPNVITACRFQEDWIEDENAEDYDMIQYQSWDTQEEHFNCLLPCLILERLESTEEGVETKYTAKLVDHHHENESIEYTCHIFRQFEYIYTDIPRRGIEFIEKTYSSDMFLLNTFRHPIHVPDDMYPEHWMRQQKSIRGGRGNTLHTPQATEEEIKEAESFKRKNTEPVTDKKDIQRKVELSPRTDL